MNNERDMYYGSYGYGYMNPMQMAQPMQPMQQMPNNSYNNTYAASNINDMFERINRLERQVKRLDQRLNRLENPYNNNYQEPDKNMYMM